MKWLSESLPFHLFTNPSVINRFVFGHWVVIYHILDHYENLLMQYTANFSIAKIEIFHWKNFDIFVIFAHNIDCGYTLEPPCRGGSNEYPQSMFWIKNKKNTCSFTPAKPSFSV